jgi:hypothetical protein
MSFMNEFSQAEEAKSGEFELVPEGEYIAQVVDVKLDMTKAPARLSLTLEIANGNQMGRRLWTNYRLQGSGLGYLKKDLKLLKIDYSNVKKEEDLASIILDASPLFVRINVVHKSVGDKVYANAYIEERVSADVKDLPF